MVLFLMAMGCVGSCIFTDERSYRTRSAEASDLQRLCDWTPNAMYGTSETYSTSHEQQSQTLREGHLDHAW
jgi:hypothetical protein